MKRSFHSKQAVRSALSTLLLVAAALSINPEVHSQTVQTWFVSMSGNDGNSGTASQPFRTIQRAANLVNPGDTVIVEDGVYTGTGSGTPCASSASRPVVCLTRGGLNGNRITFKARHVGGAKVDGQSNTSTEGFRFLANANYIDIDGFEVYGMGNANGSASGFELFNGGHDVTIAHNDIHDIGRLCTDTTNGQAGVFVEQPRVRIEGNRIHDIGRFAVGEAGCAPTTGYYKNHDHGIYVDGDAAGGNIAGAIDTWIANNLFFNHARGWAIQVYPGATPGLSILNNTFAGPNPYQDGHIILGADIVNGRIANNVFYNPHRAAINYYHGTETNLHITENLVYNATLLNTTPGGTTVLGNQVADPQFVDAATPPYDFHLRAGSPAINTGLTVVEVLVDYDGTVRADGLWDIGAFEYTGTLPSAVATPEITPDGGIVTNPITVAISTATVDATIRYTLDGTMPGPSSPTYAAPFTIASNASVRAQAVKSGLVDSAIAQATFQASGDVIAPTVSFTAPANGTVVPRSGSLTFTASASDNVAVASVRFILDGVTILTTDTIAPYSTSVNFKKARPGSHTVTAVATDQSGNTASASVTVSR